MKSAKMEQKRSDFKTKEDRRMGRVNEVKVLGVLNYEKEDKYTINPNRFDTFDFKNTEDICELKSRRNTYSQYPTTMVGYNKVEIAEKDTEHTYKFYFLFTDGLYCWTYHKDQYEVREGGLRENRKPYAFIPIKHLKLITQSISSFL